MAQISLEDDNFVKLAIGQLGSVSSTLILNTRVIMHQIKQISVLYKNQTPKILQALTFCRTWAVNAPVASTLAKMTLNEKEVNGMSNLASWSAGIYGVYRKPYFTAKIWNAQLSGTASEFYLSFFCSIITWSMFPTRTDFPLAQNCQWWICLLSLFSWTMSPLLQIHWNLTAPWHECSLYQTPLTTSGEVFCRLC